jgi:hypothetical protein
MAGLPKSVSKLLAPVLPFKGNGDRPDLDTEIKQSTFVLFSTFILTVGAGLFLIYQVEDQHLDEHIQTAQARFRDFHAKASSGFTPAILSIPSAVVIAEYGCSQVTTGQTTISSERLPQYQSFCSDYVRSLAKGNPDPIQQRAQQLADLIWVDIRNSLPLHRNSSYIWAWFFSAVLYLVAEWLLYRFSSLEHRDLEPAFNVLDVSFVGILIQYSGGFRHSMTMINLALCLYFISVIAVALDYVRSEKLSRVGLYFFALLVSLFWGVYQGNPSLQFFGFYLIALVAFALVFVLVSILALQPRAALPPVASPPGGRVTN